MNNPQIIVKNAPFKYFCMNIGAIPTSYLDSLDYYETLLWLIKYLEETIIPTVNNNGKAVSELQTLYIELKNYVDNYFTNLDVQEEINNKLDEMVEDGSLLNILSNYTSIERVYNTINDMINDTTIVNNQKIKVLGYYSIDDGGMCEFYITNTINSNIYQINLNNGLYANALLKEINNIRIFGVKGDGIIDDKINFQKALKYSIGKELICNNTDTYLISKTISIYNDTILNLNNSTINSSYLQLFYNFNPTDTYTEYNGNSNIIIKNGTINYGILSFIHGKNIVLENLTLNNGTSAHWLEICACKDFYVKNCVFNGYKLQPNSYNEYIQIDDCTSENFPHFTDSSNITYDGTCNDGVFIDNCIFKPNENNVTYNHMCTAIGGHTQPPVIGDLHKNINITNCKFYNASNTMIRLNNIKGLVIENNFIDTNEACIFTNYTCEDVYIKNNNFIGLKTGGSAIININHTTDSASYENQKNIFIENNIIKTYIQNNSIPVIKSNLTDKLVIQNNNIDLDYGYIAYLNNTSDIMIANNSFSKYILKKISIPNSSINYCDEYIFLNNTTGVQTLNLDYDITQFNELRIDIGTVSQGTYMSNIYKSYYNTNFSVNDIIPIYNGNTMQYYTINDEDTISYNVDSGTLVNNRLIMGRKI